MGKQFDAVINGFGLPYLSSEEAVRHFKNVINHLKTGRYYYISFMNIDETRHPGQESFTQNEHPSFNPSACITVTYHSQNVILKQLEALNQLAGKALFSVRRNCVYTKNHLPVAVFLVHKNFIIHLVS